MALCLLSPGFAQQAKDASFTPQGLNYCAPPAPPACVNMEAAFATTVALGQCTAKFNQYIDQVFLYRTCLDREVKRVISEANATSQAFKCRAAGRRRCK